MKSLALRAHAAGLELAWQVDADVPDSCIGDATRLRQIIVNLVANGIKFTKQGEVVVSVSRLETDGDFCKLQFKVKDTGIGIPQDRLEAVFHAFQQADSSTTRQFGGTGLGLAICARLVDFMQGEIEVESELDAGTTFTFTCGLETRSDSESVSRPDMSSLQGVHVLVVDDNETNRQILNDILNKWGLDVTLATGAGDAMLQLQTALSSDRPVSLVITDLHMLDVDGFGLSRMIRQQAGFQDIKIIMLTSGVDGDHSEKFRSLGISRHLLKPAKQSELLGAIFFALGGETDVQRVSTPARQAFDEIAPQNILLAEDGAANQKLAKALLERWGHTVTIAANGVEAVEAVQNGDFDLVLMDVQMPEMDGLDATREIRRLEQASGRHTTIIAMTAHAMAGDREKCLQSGMDEYLAKPVRKAELYKVLRRPIETDECRHRPIEVEQTKQPSVAVIDWVEARKIVDENEEVLQEIATTAIAELHRLIERLKIAVTEQDFETIKITAHSMQGALRIFQNPRASKLASAIEYRGRDENLSGIETELTELNELLGQVLDELVQYTGN